MLKRLRFLYRYLLSSRRRRRWINLQSLMVVSISAVFLSSLYMTAPISQSEKALRHFQIETTETALPSYPYPAPENQNSSGQVDPSEPTRTPLPPEYLKNADQTIGMTLSAVVLVLIVIIGALTFIPSREEQ